MIIHNYRLLYLQKIGYMYVTMGHHLSIYLGDDYYTIVAEAKTILLAVNNYALIKENCFQLSVGLTIDAIERSHIKFCTSECLKQAGISTWDLTFIDLTFIK